MRVRRARGDRDAGGDDAVRAEHADGEIGDVHRSTLAAVEAGRAAEELAHRRGDVGTLGDRVAVAAMGGGEEIGRSRLAQTPAGTASWPVERCRGPRTNACVPSAAPKAATPPLLASSAAFSNARMRTIVR